MTNFAAVLAAANRLDRFFISFSHRITFPLKEEEEEVAEEVTEADLEGGVKNEGFEKSEEVETTAEL